MSETPQPAQQQRRSKAGGRRRRQPFRVGAVLALAAAIGFVAWLVVSRSDSDSPSPTVPVASPPVPQAAKVVPISASGLRTLGGALNRPVYWAGPRPRLQYELTQASDGRIWIRYLPKSAKIGEKETPYLTVGTYPVTNAFSVTSRVARRTGSKRINVGDDAVAFHAEGRPTNIYLAFKGSNYQIEVFDPDAAAARRLVVSDKITLIPGS